MTIEDDGFVTLYATDHRPPRDSPVRAPTPSTREDLLALPLCHFGRIEVQANARGEAWFRGRKIVCKPNTRLFFPNAPAPLLAMDPMTARLLVCDDRDEVWRPVFTERGWMRARVSFVDGWPS
ncbi:MAG TPA: hypothetical protein VE907_07155 [Gammaproteobacteria bacterium]|nr:hypothetical protein [Gammaproteobacteria bacterium]